MAEQLRIDDSRIDNFDSVLLSNNDGGNQLELLIKPGGCINHLRLSNNKGISLDLVSGLDEQALQTGNPEFKGLPLFPFVNRIDAGTYTHQNVQYQFPVNEEKNNNALHGFLFRKVPRIFKINTGDESVSATLTYLNNSNNSAYPFNCTLEITYTLTVSQGLQINYRISNKGDVVIPVSYGWHPYFQLPGRLENWSLKLPDCNVIELDERSLPTGNELVNRDYQNLLPLAKAHLDNCCRIRQYEKNNKVSTFLWSEEAHAGMELWQETGEGKFNFIHVYIPPDRHSIALEPVSSNIDAFNNGDGLILLEPGAQQLASFGVKLIDIV